MTRYRKASLLFLPLLALLVASQHIREVKAEDDCAYNTWRVERLPVLGLVCIGEPYFNAMY